MARRTWLTVLVAAILTGAGAPAAQAELPLGRHGLPEQRATTQVAAGLTYTKIVRGFASPRDVYTVDAGFRPTRDAARALAANVRAAGFDARIERIADRAPDDVPERVLGFDVRSGRFADKAAADARTAALRAAGIGTVRTVFTGEDGRRTSGPWVVNVLRIDPSRLAGSVGPALATDIVPGRETPSSLASRLGALAGTNGGYFVLSPSDGTDGDLAGISVIGGSVISEAVNGRTSLVLPSPSGARARIEALQSVDGVRSSDGATRELDGLDRIPGLIRSCGGVGGDQPTERPLHDVTCADPSELIRYDARYGATTDPGPGAEAVLAPDGTVTALRDARGGAIPATGFVLAGTGDAADWLEAHATPGARIAVTTAVLGPRGPLPLGGNLGIVNGGPRLLTSGRARITSEAEGFDHPGDPEFLYRFGVRRNPRTMAGITASGRLLLVTIDGHQPGYSLGASFAEEAAVMRALGARNALNLDGGGSTAMNVEGRLVSSPSDATGERPVGDAILVRPPAAPAIGG
jgi:Phosphodiester glycosidase/SPOR domain